MSDKDLQEYEDNIKLMKEQEMKPWQKGFDLGDQNGKICKSTS